MSIMLSEASKLFVVEYSITQGVTHVRTLGAAIQNNLRNLGKGIPSDFVPIGIFNSREQAERFYLDFYRTLEREGQLELKSRNWHRVSEIARELLPKLFNEAALDI